MLSRVLGFARDILFAAILGASPIGDAFFIAFKFPNFFRRLFAEGAFNAAFIPILSDIVESDGYREGQHFVEQVLALMLTVLFAVVLLLQIFMPAVIYIFAPGFIDKPEQFNLTVQLTRITFPYLLFISLVSLMGGVLNSLGRFSAVAAAPILLNISLIGAILIGANYTPTPGHALAWGVAVAGMLQLLWLALALWQSKYVIRLRFPKLSPQIRRFLKLMLPGVLGAGVIQINLLTDIIFASILPKGSISFLYFADRVNQLPVGVIGVAIGTALLPLLSKKLASGNVEDASPIQNRAVEIALLFAVPATGALLVVAFPIVEGLFQRGAFALSDTRATGFALIGYALGLPAYVLIKVLTPAYFARKNTATPVKIAIAAVILNLFLNLTLIWWLQHVGLAIATAIAAWFNAILLFIGLVRRDWWTPDARLMKFFPRIIIATGVMVVALTVVNLFFDKIISVEFVSEVKLALLIIVGIVVFFVSAQVFRALHVGEILTILRGQQSD